ncbi:MAG TPA: hypothetical protein VMM35_06275 [Longimicrobiales bacterium]|nr:hypothetical protein [Longimicrobiales bacterium]
MASDTPPGTRPDDSTLGGYLDVHSRPPAYDGPDGHPYTVSLEVEKTSNLRAPYAGYLVFPRWATTGVGIVGHVETPTLCEGTSPDEATRRLGELTLHEVQRLLWEALQRAADGQHERETDEQ